MGSRGARGSKPRPKVYGCETPRIWTPPLRELTPQTSLGFMAIEFAKDSCKVELLPWQKWLLVHALELAPGLTVDTLKDRDPLEPILRFRRVVVLVARQNGKSTLSQILSLFFMYVLGTRLVLGTAQDLDTAEEVWDGAVALVEEEDDEGNPLRPELNAMLAKVVRRNGKRSLDLTTGERYKVKAANRKAGRGLSADLTILDELREHQSWDAWAAITKTTNARPAAQIWGLSNAGDATSVVLMYLRKMAHLALGDPDGIVADEDPASLLPDDLGDDEDLDDVDLDDLDLEDDEDTLGVFEWSATPGCDKFDRDEWAQANPSLGYTISERTLAGDAKSDPEWVYRTEVLCQWPDGALEGTFPSGAWQAGVDSRSRRAADAEVVSCVTVAHDRSRAHVTIAALREDGAIHTEVVASRAGTDWVVPWFLDDTSPHRAKWRITGQAKGAPESSLLVDLEDAGLTVVPWEGSNLGIAHGAFYDAVTRRDDEDWVPAVFHRPQPLLDVAATTAEIKPLGDGWVWDLRKSPVDASPVKGATGAVWLLGVKPEKKPEPRIRVMGARR